jgi:hypothetical protein
VSQAIAALCHYGRSSPARRDRSRNRASARRRAIYRRSRANVLIGACDVYDRERARCEACEVSTAKSTPARASGYGRAWWKRRPIRAALAPITPGGAPGSSGGREGAAGDSYGFCWRVLPVRWDIYVETLVPPMERKWSHIRLSH